MYDDSGSSSGIADQFPSHLWTVGCNIPAGCIAVPCRITSNKGFYKEAPKRNRELNAHDMDEIRKYAAGHERYTS